MFHSIVNDWLSSLPRTSENAAEGLDSDRMGCSLVAEDVAALDLRLQQRLSSGFLQHHRLQEAEAKDDTIFSEGISAETWASCCLFE
jgi:hypothetical protein